MSNRERGRGAAPAAGTDDVSATEHFHCASILQDRHVVRAAFRHGGQQLSLSDSIHGFPEWIRVTHWINFILMGFVIRAGIQILAAYPRLYWNDTASQARSGSNSRIA
jgi:hypothetical protein